MTKRFLFPLCLLLAGSFAVRAEELTYRTDGGDEKLPWYHPKPGEFPPPGSAHLMDAVLVSIVPATRSGVYRLQKDVWEQAAKLPEFKLLPGATVRRHGAPADLRDFPPGSHVTMKAFPPADSPIFSEVWSVTDTFSEDFAAGSRWRVKELDLEHGRVTLARMKEGKEREIIEISGPGTVTPRLSKILVVDERTTFWKGNGFGSKSDLAVGQDLLVNFAPGICYLPCYSLLSEVFLDEESIRLAAERQADRARGELRRRGLPAQIDAVDNKKAEITVTFFDPGFPGMLDRFMTDKRIQVAVADSALRTAEPAGGEGGPDCMSGDIIEHREVPKVEGCGGVQIVIKLPYLLEGFRPGRNVRLEAANGDNFAILPPEDRVYQ